MFSLSEMAAILGNDPRNRLPDGAGGIKPVAVVTDSRNVVPGSLFVCIKGARVDGHDFISSVADMGAAAALVSHDVAQGAGAPLPLIYSDDSVAALGRLGVAQRDLFQGFVIGVTGSAGKTSVKEALASIMAVRGATAKNFMNLNSQIGLPVSLLNADPTAWCWVMEAGINEPRDMDEVGAILRPDLAVVINVGSAHLAGLADRGVAHYKARLLRHLAPGGRALVSADYPDLVQESLQTGAELKYFSTRRSSADYHVAYLGPASAASGRYRVWIKDGGDFEVVAPFRGSYGSENVAAITGAAHMAGLTPHEITLGIARALLPSQRFACQVQGNFTLIDDSYNANPLSSARMIETAQEMAADNNVPLFLVLGEMLELGGELQNAHRELGRQIAASGARVLVWKSLNDEAAQALLEGLREGAFAGVMHRADSVEDFSGLINVFDAEAARGADSPPGAVILFKGSRSMRLELWVEAFKNDYFSQLGK